MATKGLRFWLTLLTLMELALALRSVETQLEEIEIPKWLRYRRTEAVGGPTSTRQVRGCAPN